MSSLSSTQDSELLRLQDESADTLRRRRMLRTEVAELNEDNVRSSGTGSPVGWDSTALSSHALSASRTGTFSVRSGSSGGRRRMQHWGSSLSLEGSEDGGELTSRTLRPPTPADRSTPARAEPWQTTLPRRWLPSTGKADTEAPTLKDYLSKPRLVSTLGCRQAKQHGGERSAASSITPVYRNLRLGGFLDRDDQHAELIPDELRQYYLQTYLDSYDSVYLNNYSGCNSGTSSTATSTARPFQRGM